MTRSQEIYAETLNLLGSDIPDKTIQDILDHEHALADPGFEKVLEGRQKAAMVATN